MPPHPWVVWILGVDGSASAQREVASSSSGWVHSEDTPLEFLHGAQIAERARHRGLVGTSKHRV